MNVTQVCNLNNLEFLDIAPNYLNCKNVHDLKNNSKSKDILIDEYEEQYSSPSVLRIC